MKQRLLVMNGSKVVQSEEGGEWQNKKVDKAGSLRPGIYNIYNAKQASKSAEYSGVIVHVDKDKLYQQVGKSFITHDLDSFESLPKVGSNKSISYKTDGKAVVATAQKLSRSKSL